VPRELPQVTLAQAATAPDREHRLLACALDGVTAAPAQYLGSAMLRGLAHADGFAVLPPGGAADGDTVAWVALP
jgi:molybdopterin molybdotransferase